MSKRPITCLVAIVLATIGLLVVEHVAVGPTRTYLTQVRSELQPKRHFDVQAVRPELPVRPVEARPVAAPAPMAERAELPAPNVREPRAPSWIEIGVWLAKRILVKAGVWREANLSWSEAVPNSDQGMLTAETHALALVVNDPVLPHTGEMTFRQPIVSVPGTGFDFSFQLVYRSGYSYNGPIGKRWEHNWNVRFEEPSSSTLNRYANGRRDTYTETSSGSNLFSSPAGQFEKSVKRQTVGSDKIVERTLQDGTVEKYKMPGGTGGWYYLESVTHRVSNNAINLSYDAYHRLTTITDTRGRQFKLVYDGNGRVTDFEDYSSGTGSIDRKWRFAYDGSSNLATMILPDVGATTRTMLFSYSSERLTDVKAPREVASSGSSYLHLDYDNDFKVTSQRFGETGQTYSLSYGTGSFTEIDRAGTQRVYEFDTTTKAITRVRTRVATTPSTVYHDTEYVWEGNLVAKVTYPEGNGVRYVYDGGRLTTMARCTASGMTGTISRGSSNYLVTSYTYQSATAWTLVTKVTDPKGNDWQLARDSSGNVTSYKTPEHASDPWVLSYDSAGRVVSMTDPEGRLKTFVYSATGTLSKIATDPATLNLTMVYDRDQFENVTRVTDALGHQTTYARNILGYVTKVTTPEGHETDYAYDLNDLVTQVLSDNANADMPNTRHKVVVEHNLLDIATKVKEYYAASHASSRIWSYDHDAEDRLTRITLPESARQIEIGYDIRGLEVTRFTAADTSDETTERYEYDKNRRLTKSYDGRGNATTVHFDGFDRATKVTDAASHYRETAFDVNGNVVTQQAFNASTTKLTERVMVYDKDNRLTKTQDWAKKSDLSTSIGSGVIERTLVYDKAGLLKTKLDPCGCGGSTETRFTHDTASRVVTVRDALGNLVRYGMDKVGRTTKLSTDEVESGTTKTYVKEYSYDDDGNLTTVDDKGNGSSTALTTTMVVDARGRVRQTTDPNGNIVLSLRDDFGRVTTTKRQLTGGGTPTYIETRTVYDLNDNVRSRVLERGATDGVTEYVYDNADRVVTAKDEGVTYPERFVYDPAGNVSLFYDRNGSTVSCSYDGLNQLTRKDYTKATDVQGPSVVKFYYDGVGRIVTAWNGDARVERTWNTLSKLEREKTWIDPSDEAGSGSTPKDVDYEFDSGGRVSLVEYPDNRITVKREYDGLNRVTKIEKKIGSGSFGKVADWTFSGPSRMLTLALGNDTKEGMSYDVYGRATNMAHDRPTASGRKTMYEFRRDYDAGSRPVYEERDYYKSSDSTILGGNRDYGDRYYYDAVDRLTKVIRGAGKQTANHDAVRTLAETSLDYVTRTEYSFDEAGNRKTLMYWASDNSTSWQTRKEQHAFDIMNELTLRDEYVGNPLPGTPTTSISYSYDKNGNQISETSKSRIYVDMENRIYRYGDWYYKYDPFGRRILKTDESQSGLYHRWFFYDGVTCIQEFYYCLDHHVPDSYSGPDPVWTRIYGPYLVDQILWGQYDVDGEEETGVQPYFFHLDYLGSVVMLTDTATNPSLVESYRYDEYGQPYFFDGNGSSLAESGLNQDKLYTGRRWDCECELYHNRRRHFSCSTGVFMSRDPLGAGAVQSLYAYVDDNPTNYLDPFGEQKRAQHDWYLNILCGEGPPPPWVPFFWKINTCGPCPPTDPGSAVGDGWCNDGTGHPGAKNCYRSYGHATEMACGQQCCYGEDGNLIVDGGNSQGTVDVVGPNAQQMAENADGSCQTSTGQVVSHILVDWAASVVVLNDGRPIYLAVQQCMRDEGIPSGSSGGGNPSGAEVSAAYDRCKSKVVRYVSWYGISVVLAVGISNLPEPGTPASYR